MTTKPAYIFLIIVIIGIFSCIVFIDSISSLLGRILIGLLFGVGCGIIAFDNKSDPYVAKLFGLFMAFFICIGFICFYILSTTMTTGSLISGFFLSGVLYYAASRID